MKTLPWKQGHSLSTSVTGQGSAGHGPRGARGLKKPSLPGEMSKDPNTGHVGQTVVSTELTPLTRVGCCSLASNQFPKPRKSEGAATAHPPLGVKRLDREIQAPGQMDSGVTQTRGSE